MAGLMSLVTRLGSTQLQNIVANLESESAVSDGRTAIDYKLFDRRIINNNFGQISQGAAGETIISGVNYGTMMLPSILTFFDKTASGKTLQPLNVFQENVDRINNLIVDGKADEPYRFDRLAVDVEVYDCDVEYGVHTSGSETNDEYKFFGKGGQSELAIATYKKIMQSGSLSVKVNGKDLNYAEPLGFAGSSCAIDGSENNVFNKKTPKFIDPAIFLPETTSFSAKIEFIEPVMIPQQCVVAITVSLLGYKFLKNS